MILVTNGVRAVSVEVAEGGAIQSTEATPLKANVVVALVNPRLRFEQGLTSALLVARREEVAAFCHETLSLLGGGKPEDLEGTAKDAALAEAKLEAARQMAKALKELIGRWENYPQPIPREYFDASAAALRLWKEAGGA